MFSCVLSFSLSLFGSSFFSDQKWCIYRAWKLLEVSRIWLNLERHHLASKVTPLSRIYNFQGNFVHPDNFISRKFLHESCRKFCYLFNLNHLIWMSVDRVMAEIRKLLKSGKVATLGQDMNVTTHHRNSRWRLVHMVTTRHPSLLIQTWFFCFLTCSNQFQVSYKAY